MKSQNSNTDSLKVILGNLSNVIAFLVGVIATFFLTPLLIHSLGRESYGLWLIIVSAVGYLSLMDLGMQGAVLRFVSKSRDESKQKVNQVISSSIIFYTAIMIALGFISAIALYLSSETSNEILRMAAILMIADALIALPAGVFQSVLYGYQRYTEVSLFLIAHRIFYTVILCIFIHPGTQLDELAWLMFSLGLVKHLGLIMMCCGYEKLYNPLHFSYNKTALKDMIGYGSKTLVANLLGKLHLQSAPLLLGYQSGAAAVPNYNIPSKLTTYGTQLLFTLNQGLLPLFSRSEKDGKDALRSIYLKYSRFSCLVFFPVIALLAGLGPSFIAVWIDPVMANDSRTTLYLLAAAMVLPASQPLTGRYLMGVSKQGITIRARLITVLIFLPLAYLLGKELSAVGIAIAFAISVLVMELQLFFAVHKDLEINAFRYFYTIPFAPMTIAAVITTGLLQFEYHNYTDIIIAATLSILTYFVAVYITVLSSDEKSLVNSKFILMKKKLLRHD